MRVPARVLRALGVLALVALLALAGAGAWLFGTSQGLAWTLARLAQAAGGALQVDAPRGTLGGGFSAERVVYTSGGTRLVAHEARLRASLLSIVLLRPEIARLEASSLDLALPASSTGGAAARPPALPVPVVLDRVRIGTVNVRRGAQTVTLKDLRFGYRYARARHRVRDLHVELANLTLEGRAALGAAPPHAVSGALRLSGERSGVPFDARAELSGDLERIGLQGRVEAKSAVAELRATLRPSEGLPPDSLEIEARDLDLRAFDAALPKTKLRVTAKLARRGEALAGPVSVSNALAGRPGAGRLPVDALQGMLHADLKQAELTDLVVRLPGSGKLSGRLGATLAAQPSFESRLALERVDVSQLAAGLPASTLSGTASVSGTLGSERRLRAQFSLASSSRLAGRAVSGGGGLRVEGERIAESKLDLQASGATVHIEGAFGRPDDHLRVNVAAADLSSLYASLAGRGSLSGELWGGWKEPAARLKASGAGVALGAALRVNTLELDARVSADRTRPLHVAASASGVAAHGLRAERFRATVDGTAAAHTVELAAQGRGFDFTARLEGALRGSDAWSGKLLAARNRGTVPFVLEAPAALSAAPRRYAVRALELRFDQGRARVAELRWDEGRLTTSGALHEVDLLPLLRLAGVETPLQGKLALGAEWSLSSERETSGSFRLWRERGDLEFGGAESIAMGLKTLELNGRIDAGRLDVSGRLAAAIGTSELSLRLAPAPGGGTLPWSDASPLEATVSARLDSLAPFDVLIDRSARIDGRLQATLRAQGTLAAPQISGELQGDQLRYVRPPDGVDLVDGRLRARLDQNTLQVTELRISGAAGGSFSAHGTLAHRETEHAAIGWSADQLVLLDRPDQRLVISGEGGASIVQRRLALAGSLRVDSGFFSFEQTALPQLGQDVVVAGRGEAAPREQRIGRRENPSPLDVDLQIDLGKALEIQGHGLDTRLAGKVHVYTNDERVLLAKGTVRAVRGTVTAYGARLQIERGRVIFDGPVGKPSLDIVAMRRNQEVAAGVAVTGTLQNPDVRVVSDPQVPEGEALSWLVLGHAPGSGGGADIGLLQAAAGALLGKQAGGASGSLAKALGVDTISVGGAPGLAGQFVTVGKRINDRLSVFYEQGLGATASVLRLNFELSRHWSLTAAGGQQGDVGVRYHYSFD